VRTVVLVSADVEWAAVTRLLPNAQILNSPPGSHFNFRLGERDILFFHGGWGKISAAATTQYVIDVFQPDLLANLGTCGGLQGKIERGAIVLVERTLVYDVVELMIDESLALQHYSTELDLTWLPRPEPSRVRRVRMLSADRDILPQDVPALIQKYDAIVGDWESGAIAWVATKNGVKCLILRGVSDLVGEGGGEAYSDRSLFAERTEQVMKSLIDLLPAWLAAIEENREPRTA
jgi:adenosylhomocysteine nucleosidase